MKHYLGICLVLITLAAIGFFALHSCMATVDQTIDHVRDAFTEVLRVQPKVTLDQRVILTQTAPIAELAVVTKEELVTIGLNEHLEVMSMQIPLTEKKITAEATYRLKSGFDLREPFTVDIDPVAHTLHAAMPHAKILSVEQTGEVSFHGEDSVLNRITDMERAQILTDLNAAAHAEAEKSGLKTDAERQVGDRLTEIMSHNGQAMEIEWEKLPPAPAP
jgi:hypothetical protein